MLTQWLTRRVSMADVEARLAGRPPGEKWQAFVAQMQSGDELWEFCSPPRSWKCLAGRAGYAIVHEGEIVAFFITRLN